MKNKKLAKALIKALKDTHEHVYMREDGRRQYTVDGLVDFDDIVNELRKNFTITPRLTPQSPAVVVKDEVQEWKTRPESTILAVTTAGDYTDKMFTPIIKNPTWDNSHLFKDKETLEAPDDSATRKLAEAIIKIKEERETAKRLEEEAKTQAEKERKEAEQQQIKQVNKKTEIKIEHRLGELLAVMVQNGCKYYTLGHRANSAGIIELTLHWLRDMNHVYFLSFSIDENRLNPVQGRVEYGHLHQPNWYSESYYVNTEVNYISSLEHLDTIITSLKSKGAVYPNEEFNKKYGKRMNWEY